MWGGIILAAVSAILFFLQNRFWYFIAPFAVLIIFDRLSSYAGNKTTLDLIINKKYKSFIKLFLLLFFLGVAIEVVGSHLLGLWSYPKLWSLEPMWFMLMINFIGYLTYPVILMSFREMYALSRSLIKTKFLAVAATMVAGIIVWELPNVISKDWIYRIPYVSWSILGVNIVVIVGWVILILGPYYVYELLDL